MNLYKHSIASIGLLLYVGMAHAQVVCQIQPKELNNYSSQLIENADSPSTVVRIEKGSTKDALSIAIGRTGFAERKLADVTLQNEVTGSEPPTVVQEARTYRGIIIPPTVSENSVRFDLAPTGVFELGNPRAGFVAASLGAEGAIVLIDREDVELCIAKPRVFYVLPVGKTSGSSTFAKQTLFLESDAFKRLVLEIFQANGDYTMQDNNLDELFSSELKGSTLLGRGSMITSPVSVQLSGAVRGLKQALQVTSGEQLEMALPLAMDWNRAVSRLTRFPEFSVMAEASEKLFPNYANAGWDARLREVPLDRDVLNSALGAAEKLLIEGAPILELANKAYDSAKSRFEINRSVLPSNKVSGQRLAYEGQELANTEREIGNFKFSLDRVQSDYESWYPLKSGGTLPSAQEGFDMEALIRSKPDTKPGSCELAAQRFKSVNATIPVKERSIVVASNLIVTYKQFKDPQRNIEVVRPEFTWVGDVSQIKSLHQQIVADEIPASSCRDRYTNSRNFTQKVEGMWISGASDVTYERWMCEEHEWICFKGWIPRSCKNSIKTRLYRVESHPTFSFTAGLASQDQLSMTLSSNVSATTTQQVGLGLDTQPNWDQLKETVGLEWRGVHFATAKADKSKVLMVLKGQGKPVRRNTACVLHETVDQLLNPK